MLSKIKTLLLTSAFLFAGISYSNAEQFSAPGFSGNINTTLTTGLSVRTDENCLALTGFQDVPGDATFASKVNTFRSADAAVLLAEYEPGCGKIYIDGYGNPYDEKGVARELISNNADDGRNNFRKGDIFNSTTRLYTEIDGSFNNGTSLRASFVGSYNPITSFKNPSWAPFTSDQLDDIETNIDVLDFYLTSDIGTDTTINLGRFVTNWGESTFIPVGMNGLTTNAIDLSKLRQPGSSIKEALLPTEQVTVSGYLEGGVSYEAYVQFNESHVEFDTAGTFFGNEVIDGDRLVFTSQFGQNRQIQSQACTFLNSMPVAAGGKGHGCDQDAVDFYNTAAGRANTAMAYFQNGVSGLVSSTHATQILSKSAALGAAAPAAAAIGGAAGDMVTLGANLGAAGIAGVAAGFAAWDEYTNKQARKAGALDASGGNHIYADGDEQYGIALRTYLDNVGSGVDLGFYFTQYDSKVPYLQFIGKQGIHAGDLLGLYTLAATCSGSGAAACASGTFATGAYFENSGSGDRISGFTSAEATSALLVAGALGDLAYSEAGCSAYQNPKAVDEFYNAGGLGDDASNFAYTGSQKANALTYYNYTVIGGKLYHDSTKCYDNANDNSVANVALGVGSSLVNFQTASTQAAAAALLGAAVQPLNSAEYRFIYPENLKAIGLSANTNIGGTTVQAEITFRPDFPLATNGGDQGQQLSDAAGTTNLLSIGVAQGIRGKCALAGGSAVAATLATQSAAIQTACAAQTAAVTSYRMGTGDADAEWANVVRSIQDFKRSSLPQISLATVAGGDYYTTAFIKEDVISGTIGTTSSFSASHPITAGLGADSSVFLTEFGFVSVPSADYANGGINRGGYRDGVGGVKCGGVSNGGLTGAPTTFNSTRALDGATHLGSAQTDPLFGNGSYCESKNTIDNNSYTYRLIGSATYNNVANSAWTFSPSIIWSHDFKGYGPTSMGGFVPGRQSLSLSGNLTKGDMSVGLSYVNELGDEKDNLNFDKDYISASVSYAF